MNVTVLDPVAGRFADQYAGGRGEDKAARADFAVQHRVAPAVVPDAHAACTQVGEGAVVYSGLHRTVLDVHAVGVDVFDPTVLEQTVVSPPKCHRRGYVHGGLLRPRFSLRQTPFAVRERQALEAQMRCTINFEQLLQQSRDNLGVLDILPRHGDVVELLRGPVQVPFAGFGQGFEDILHDEIHAIAGLPLHTEPGGPVKLYRLRLRIDAVDIDMPVDPPAEKVHLHVVEVVPIRTYLVRLADAGSGHRVVPGTVEIRLVMKATRHLPQARLRQPRPLAALSVDPELREPSVPEKFFRRGGREDGLAMDRFLLPRPGDATSAAEDRRLSGISSPGHRPCLGPSNACASEAAVLIVETPRLVQLVNAAAEHYAEFGGGLAPGLHPPNSLLGRRRRFQRPVGTVRCWFGVLTRPVIVTCGRDIQCRGITHHWFLCMVICGLDYIMVFSSAIPPSASVMR